MDWKDFPRIKEKLAIVGFSETSRELAPYDDPEFEIWGLNEEHAFPWMKRFDRWFQMHPKWDFTRENNLNCPNHYLWLKNESGPCVFCKGIGKKDNVDCTFCGGTGTYVPNSRDNVLLYTREAFPELPNNIVFPLKEATNYVGLPYPYFTSTPAFMFVLAMMMDYKEIGLYGFEMGTLTEYHYQKACMEYLIGLGMGRGFTVTIPENCGLLKGKLYSFDTMHIGYRQQLEIRKSNLYAQSKVQQEKRVRTEGRLEAMKELGVPDTVMKEEVKKYAEQLRLVNVIGGAIAETENLTNLYDSYFLGDKDGFEASREHITTHYTKD